MSLEDDRDLGEDDALHDEEPAVGDELDEDLAIDDELEGDIEDGDEDEDESVAIAGDDIEDEPDDIVIPDDEEEDEEQDEDDEEDEPAAIVDEESPQASLEELLSQRAAARRGAAGVEEEADIMELASRREARAREKTVTRLDPIKSDQEFVCARCHLVKPKVQLANRDRGLCRDCV